MGFADSPKSAVWDISEGVEPKVRDGMQRGACPPSSSLDLILNLQLYKLCMSLTQSTSSLTFLGCWRSWCVSGRESESY